ESLMIRSEFRRVLALTGITEHSKHCATILEVGLACVGQIKSGCRNTNHRIDVRNPASHLHRIEDWFNVAFERRNVIGLKGAIRVKRRTQTHLADTDIDKGISQCSDIDEFRCKLRTRAYNPRI